MQLNEILEKNSVSEISTKTNISENNLEALVAENFKILSKPKALGFISIIEREYNADLAKVRKQALAYYAKNNDENISLSMPPIEEEKGRSPWVPILMLGLLAYASWYFFTQFDKKTLSTILPFSDSKTEVSPNIQMDNQEDKSLSIESAFTQTQTDASGVQSDILVEDIEPKDTSVVSSSTSVVESNTIPVKQNQHTLVRDRKISLVPAGKLWFGIIDMQTGKKNNFTISETYDIDVKNTSWLLSTSVAPFAFINQNEVEEYNDAKTHYFKVSKLGIESLSKVEYLALGGYKKW